MITQSLTSSENCPILVLGENRTLMSVVAFGFNDIRDSGEIDRMFVCCSSKVDGVIATLKSMDAILLLMIFTDRFAILPMRCAPRLIFLSAGFTTSTLSEER